MLPCTRPLVLAFVLFLLMLPAGGCQPAEPAPADRAGPRVETLSPDAASVPQASEERAAVGPTAVPTVSPGESLPTGRRCRVHLRRDALGFANPAPLAVQQQPRGNSRATLIEGTIERATNDWIIVRSGDGTYWVRTAFVLAVEFPDKQ